MEINHNQQIYSDEVQDILLDAPKHLYFYSLIGIVTFFVILIIISFSFQYSETQQINITLTRPDGPTKSSLTRYRNLDTSYIAVSRLSQSIYGKIKHETVVTLEFPLYPVDKFGIVDGVILKSELDAIDDQGRIETIIGIKNIDETALNRKIYFKKNIQGKAIIIYSKGNIISKIFE